MLASHLRNVACSESGSLNILDFAYKEFQTILILISLGRCQLKREERYVKVILICDLGCKDRVWNGPVVGRVQWGFWCSLGLIFLFQ